MLNIFVIIIALFASASVAVAETASNATPRFPILIVDVKNVLDDSKAAIGAQKKIETQRSAFQDEISAKEKNIRDAEQVLLQQRGKLDEKAYAEKETQLRQKFRDVEKYVQERRQALEKATTQSMGKVRAVMQDIVADIAKKRGAQAVMAKQTALWTLEGNDITAEVSSRLNSQLPDVPVNIDVPEIKKEPAK